MEEIIENNGFTNAYNKCLKKSNLSNNQYLDIIEDLSKTSDGLIISLRKALDEIDHRNGIIEKYKSMAEYGLKKEENKINKLKQKLKYEMEKQKYEMEKQK